MHADVTRDLIVRIDACLPQTQCTRCGYPDCRTYAAAIAAGDADINRCPPGEPGTAEALAKLLAVVRQPLAPECGEHQSRRRAQIDEQTCIGCRKCIDACPLDAIIGARKLMHTVIIADCSGCELCLPPCPVDCIRMIPASPPAATGALWAEYTRAETNRWRSLAEARRARLAQRTRARGTGRGRQGTSGPDVDPERTRIRAEIRAAVERARARKRKP